jgi:hypothetical protein
MVNQSLTMIVGTLRLHWPLMDVINDAVASDEA